jgi:hypothetical protein
MRKNHCLCSQCLSRATGTGWDEGSDIPPIRRSNKKAAQSALGRTGSFTALEMGH